VGKYFEFLSVFIEILEIFDKPLLSFFPNNFDSECSLSKFDKESALNLALFIGGSSNLKFNFSSFGFDT